MLIREQVRKAKLDTEARAKGDEDEEERELKRAAGEKIKLSFGKKPATSTVDQPSTSRNDTAKDVITPTIATEAAATNPSLLVIEPRVVEEAEKADVDSKGTILPAEEMPAPPSKVPVKIGFQSKPKNVFAVAKKNALAGKKVAVIEQPKKMSEAERIKRRLRGKRVVKLPPLWTSAEETKIMTNSY
jgi:DNA/RNA-binding protein KIN17